MTVLPFGPGGTDRDHVLDVLAERALGILGDEDAARVDAHLSSCAGCADTAAGLAATVAVLMAVPVGDEPPPGFADRVLASLPPSPSIRPPAPNRAGTMGRRRHVWGRVIAVAAALLIGFGIGRLVYGSDDPAAAMRTSTLISADGAVAGTVVLLRDGRWMAMQLDHVKPGVAYHCELLLDDGSTIETADWSSNEAHAGWTTAIPVDPADVREVRVIGSHGVVRSRASF